MTAQLKPQEDTTGMQTIDALHKELDGAVDFHQLRVEDIIHLSARLAQVLAQEADLLERMQVGKIAGLQKEKTMLTNALELTKKQVAKRPEILEDIDEETRENLREIVTVFNQVLEENYRRLNTARLVNQRIVQAITEVVSEQASRDGYDQKGHGGRAGADAVCVTLDEKI